MKKEAELAAYNKFAAAVVELHIVVCKHMAAVDIDKHIELVDMDMAAAV